MKGATKTGFTANNEYFINFKFSQESSGSAYTKDM